MPVPNLPVPQPRSPAWNCGRIVGQKRALLPRHVWAIRVRLELAGRVRDLALFNMAIDSKLRGCDLVRLRVADVFAAGRGEGARQRRAEQDAAPCPVRDHRDDTGGGPRLDRKLRHDRLGPSLAEPVPWQPAHLDPPIRPDAQGLGRVNRAGAERLRHALDASHEGRADLQEDRQPADRPTAPRPHEDGQHRPLPRGRAGGRAGDLRGHRPLVARRGGADVPSDRSISQNGGRSDRLPSKLE